MRYPIQLSCWLRPRQRQFGWTRNTSVVTDGTKPKPLAAIPGPSGLSALPYIGLMFELKPFTNYDVKKLSELFEKYREQYGPLVKIRAGKDWLVCVYDPDDIAAVFRTESRHPYRGVTPLAKTYDRRKGVRPGLVTLVCENYIDDALTKVNNTTNFHDATVQNPEIQSWNTKQSFDADVQNTQHPTNVNTTDMEDSLLFDLLSTPGMTPDMTRRILVDVFVAGIDSTANAMTFLFYFLAKHQDKQRKLYQELLDVIPKDGKITEDVIKKLSYLKACVKESLRLVFPICAGTARILDLDIVLKGYKVPKGTTLVLCNGIICREERYFPQQDQFLPERWIRGDIRTDVNPFAHLPFGFGPRKCIGQRVAELEIYICTAKMFMTYRFKLPPGVDEIPYKYCTFATPREKTTFMLERRVTTWHS
ncbi:probable cytochrome P450 12d1 distal, mitochondrial isoform X2 [Mizuhopecten yessoensis]|uniref:probable cytochrome P450 12d1 distal, mitochondrial isoform X2 n=1 Tax=Mizuhopecten yessoensis TaxID=6573 RepID=UPI000B4579B4|nr:probable cytochrome P450 12d1 distal, mitochondrial isoform X2 [Mizuhopecten yessoensis]